MRALKEILLGKSFASLAGNAIGALLGLATFAFLARYLSKDDFGSWILFITIYSLFDTLRIGMVLNALVKNIAKAVNAQEEAAIMGSSVFITVLLTIVFAILILIIWLTSSLFNFTFNVNQNLFWLIITAIVTLPHNLATWYFNAKLKIISMSLVRIINQVIFLVIIFTYVRYNTSVENVFYAYTVSHISVALVCIIAGWSGLQHVFKYQKQIMKVIFNFGKYSMGTLLGSSLLRSSDTFIINSLLNAAKVAVYNVPMRVIELIEMPLRSFAITALPQFAELWAKGERDLLRSEFERRSGAIFFLLLPVSLFCLLFAEYMVVWLGGEGYSESAILLRLFAMYTAILPLDKFSGIMLDVIDMPEMNFVKVMLMLFVNIVGDIIALKVFGSLQGVAIVSTLTFLTGFLFGFYMIRKHLNVSLTRVFKFGFIDISQKVFKVLKFA